MVNKVNAMGALAQGQRAAQAYKMNTLGASATRKDSVQISESAQAAFAETPAAERAAKLARIKSEIDAGTYLTKERFETALEMALGDLPQD